MQSPVAWGAHEMMSRFANAGAFNLDSQIKREQNVYTRHYVLFQILKKYALHVKLYFIKHIEASSVLILLSLRCWYFCRRQPS